MPREQGLNRRNFMRAGLGTAVVAGVPLTAAGAAAAQGRGRQGWGRQGDVIQPGPFVVPRDRIGIQVYMVRDRFGQDPEGTLEALADIGYRELELAGYGGLSVVQLRRAVRRLGLRVVASHEGLGRFRDNPEAMLADARFLGQRWVVLPSIPGGERTPAGYAAVAETLNEVGRMARRHGLRVGYHNHDFEFQRGEDGRFGFEILLEETDPQLVDFELDLYWAMEGMFSHGNHEAHPIELFVRDPGRFKLFHVKDGVPEEQPGRRFADVGEGTIDFTQIFRAQPLSGVEHYFVERDDAPSDPEGSLGSAEDSYDNLVEQYSNRRAGRGGDDDHDL